MKIVIIYGSPRKGVTYQCIKAVKETMLNAGEVEFEEFFLPKDVPNFCKGCFSCFANGESTCADAQYITPVVTAMENADGFIISSPVYVMQITAGLKALFDHMAYCYLNHRPRFFDKKAIIITTSAGGGIKNCINYITENLRYWGVNKIYSAGMACFSDRWESITEKKKADMLKLLNKKASAFYNDIKSKRLYKPTYIQVIMFYLSRLFMKRDTYGGADRQYWSEKGWTDKKARYYNNAPLGWARPATAKALSFVMDKLLR